jgi:hypothetical protein
MKDLQAELDALAQVFGRGVSVDDLAGRVIAHSVQTDLVDEPRIRGILTRRVPPDVRAWQESHVGSSTTPVHLPANPALGMAPRLCVPLPRDGVLVGYLWVIEGDEPLDPSLVDAEALARLLTPAADDQPIQVFVVLAEEADPQIVTVTPPADPVRFAERLRVPGSMVGFSAVHPGSRFADVARREALTAAELPRLDPALPAIQGWETLGFYRLLLGSGPSGGPVDRLPAALRETLETYLDSGCDTRATADSLHLHRTSLYYRLTRIEQLTGVDLSSGTGRLELHLALKLARLARRTRF